MEGYNPTETIPQPGESSGKSRIMEMIESGECELVHSESMSLEEIFNSEFIDQDSIPYYRGVLEDVLNNNLDYEVTAKVKEYADYLLLHPETFNAWGPIQFLDNRLHDGSHRLSTIFLLSKLYPDSQWEKRKYTVDFYKGL
jgi:hypothetical protein